MKANQRKLLILLAVIFWMAIIFKLSAQPGEQSNILSAKVTNVIVSVVQQFRPDVNIVSLNYFIRKCAFSGLSCVGNHRSVCNEKDWLYG